MDQPKLLPKHIRALYLVKEHDGLPMTHHARAAVETYLARYPGIETVLSRAGSVGSEPSRRSQVVQGTANPASTSVEDVRIDHRRRDVGVRKPSRQTLRIGSDQKFSSERIPEAQEEYRARILEELPIHLPADLYPHRTYGRPVA